MELIIKHMFVMFTGKVSAKNPPGKSKAPSTSPSQEAKPASISPLNSCIPILSCSRYLQLLYRVRQVLSVPPTFFTNRSYQVLVNSDDTRFVLHKRTGLKTTSQPPIYTLSSEVNTLVSWVMTKPPPQFNNKHQGNARAPRVTATETIRFSPPRRIRALVVQNMTRPMVYTFCYNDITSVCWVTTAPPPLITMNIRNRKPVTVCSAHGNIFTAREYN